jgi:hypothetical protein
MNECGVVMLWLIAFWVTVTYLILSAFGVTSLATLPF